MSRKPVSPNTQAILLLTAPLIVGSGTPSTELLSAGEYRRLARHLRAAEREPADLLSPDAPNLIRSCAGVIDEARLQALLDRGFLSSQAVERWQTRAIWVVSRADPEYPRRLKVRLREEAPIVLYGCGDPAILKRGGLAVVGSRHVDEWLIEYTMDVGRLSARAGKTIVSGGARGIDQAAMRGALDAGGKVIGVLGDSLEKGAMNRENRKLLIDGQLVLVSPYDPSAGFNVGHAMQRNKSVYALADAALVVSSDVNKGGTWAGATEQLDKHHFLPVYVRSTGDIGNGLEALRLKGARPWPNPESDESFAAIFQTPPAKDEDVSEVIELPLFGQTLSAKPAVVRETLRSNNTPQLSVSVADELFAVVRTIISGLLQLRRTEKEVAELLCVSPPQAKLWLQRLVDEGAIEKTKRPSGYSLKRYN